jgi:6-phosphogluconolactonase
MTTQTSGLLRVYIGTYTNNHSAGISVGTLDSDTGHLEINDVAVTGIENPSYLTLDGPRRRLYAVSEVTEFLGQSGGGIVAYALDADTGWPTLLNSKSSGGEGPCHLSVDAAGRFVLAANYGSGSVAMLPLDADGALTEASGDVVPHQGSGVHPTRQVGPHAHCVLSDSAGKFALAADLGLDRILVYAIDAHSGRLLPQEQLGVNLRPGAGPRHLVFSPDSHNLYGINELDNTVTVWEYESETGRLHEVQTVSTLPEGFTGVSFASDIQMHPSGSYLYGANRGHDSLAVFAVARDTGRLTPRGHVPAGGQNPRGFGLDPSGAFLLCAHQDSNTIAVFAVNSRSGDLEPIGQVVSIPTPTCVRIEVGFSTL